MVIMTNTTMMMMMMTYAMVTYTMMTVTNTMAMVTNTMMVMMTMPMPSSSVATTASRHLKNMHSKTEQNYRDMEIVKQDSP